MSLFTENLTMTHLNADWRLWELETPLSYEIGALGSGRMVEVPAGFITDGASVPRVFWSLFPAWGRYSRAAVIHDWLCVQYDRMRDGKSYFLPDGITTRKEIDAIFLEAMGVLGVALPARVLIWAAVRAWAIGQGKP